MFYGLNFAWHWSPITLAGLIVVCLLYIFAIRWARRENAQEKPLPARRVVSFIVAVSAIALMLLTPIDTIARAQLFSVHMFQAVMLITLCAPPLLYALPPWVRQPPPPNPVRPPLT